MKSRGFLQSYRSNYGFQQNIFIKRKWIKSRSSCQFEFKLVRNRQLLQHHNPFFGIINELRCRILDIHILFSHISCANDACDVVSLHWYSYHRDMFIVLNTIWNMRVFMIVTNKLLWSQFWYAQIILTNPNLSYMFNSVV